MKILCVCLGNICRSPAAEGILRYQINQKIQSCPLEKGGRRGFLENISVDSAGTGSWHVGEPPDKRSTKVCHGHNIDISDQRSRQLVSEDGEIFDLILCMDQSNIANAKDIIPSEYHHKIQLFDNHEVNDPYYSLFDGFEIMFQQLERAAERWIDLNQ